jgi:predicted O-linked N-acetylglucosamine transferase (SPINDLY family)
MTESAKPDHASVLWQRLKQAVTHGPLWLALARCYASHGLAWQAGYAARQALRCDAALAPQLQALAIGAWRDATAGDALLGRAALPDATELIERYSDRVAACPGDWLTWLYLARLREMSAAQEGVRHAASTVALQQAQILEPVSGESLHWMGVWRLNAGDAQGAVTALSGLIDIRPLRSGSMMYLGEALLRIGNTAAAEKAFARASLSNNTDFLLTLSARVYACNYWQEAIAVLRKALTLKPDSVSLWLALAKTQSEVYQLADCRESLRQAQALAPDNAQARLLRAGLQGRMGDAKGHLALLQAAYDAGGDPLSRLASSIAMTSLYHDELPAAAVAALHQRLCEPLEAAVTQKSDFARPAAVRAQGCRWRIGYVTGDFHRQHPVTIFMLPVLRRHDHARFEVCVYHTGSMHDEYTRQAKGCADRWLEAGLLDDAALHQAIVADGIDILVDLAGHTASHRLGVFAMRAAPVQATFLGYPHSTGLSTIDWLIGDATVSPAEHAHLYSEGLAQLPHSVFCWAPVDAYPLPPPRTAAAPVVFGSFNNAMKLSPKTIALWAQVLRAAPDSRLLLKAPSLRDGEVQAHFAALFAAHGIGAERVMFRGPSGLAHMMQEYGDIDIALDPTPYNGGTTTLQALWMGVPVVTLAGGNFVSRMGASFLRTLGRHDWVAVDEAAYVAIATRLANACGAVRASRGQLRTQIAASPLSDIRSYTRHFETLLQRMWQTHCEGNAGRILQITQDGSVGTGLKRGGTATPCAAGSQAHTSSAAAVRNVHQDNSNTI